jgi:hypothetical protein
MLKDRHIDADLLSAGDGVCRLMPPEMERLKEVVA